MHSTRLQDEIKQTRPFRSPGQAAVIGLLRTADHVQARFGGVVERAGVTPQQYNVLRILRGAGREGLPTLEIGERMIERTPGVTRLVDRLEEKRLVRRSRCPEDRRRVICTITPSGLELLARLDEPIDALDDRLDETLGEADLLRLVELLDAVRARF